MHPIERKMSAYIEVLPSAELDKYDLKGLTPDMFCVNIADMVNMHRLFSGQVENEKQIPVARWAMNHEEYLEATRNPATKLTHRQIVHLLTALPGFVRESDNQYIDFEESVVAHSNADNIQYSGYRLTIVTEDIEGDISSHAYYTLDSHTAEGWQGVLPPAADHKAIQNALDTKIQVIKNAGVQLAHVNNETD